MLQPTCDSRLVPIASHRRRTEEDVNALACFPQLETVHAENCRDYDSLLRLREAYPNVTVSSRVTLDGTEYPADTESVELKTASAQNLSMLPLLTNLHTVTVANSEGDQDFSALIQYCRDNDLNFWLHIGEELVDTNVQELTVEGITDADLPLLASLPNLKKLHRADGPGGHCRRQSRSRGGDPQGGRGSVQSSGTEAGLRCL